MSKDAIRAWPAHGLQKIFADTPPPEVISSAIVLEAAAGECEVAQIAVRAVDHAVILDRPTVTALRSDAGEIGADRVTCRFVDLVPVRYNTQGVPPSERLRSAPSYFPDPLCVEDRMHLAGEQTRSVWIRVEVPSDAAPGEYTGTITVRSDSGNAEVAIRLVVWPVSLPVEPSCSMTLWVWPFIIAKYHGVRLYSEDFWSLLRRYAAEMAAHRQDTIFTPIVGPDALIDVSMTTQGDYRFDFSNFDRWVEIFFEAGFRQIEGSHVYDDSIRFLRVRGASGTSRKIVMGGRVEDFVTNDDYMTMIQALFTALRDHLRDHDWSDRYLQHVFDEPAGDEVPIYVRIAKMLRSIWPEVRFIDAADADPALFDVIDVLVPLVDHPSYFNDVATHRAAGKTLWAYTSNHPRKDHPGTFLDLPLVKVRILPWIMWRYGITGYLYYALGYWEVQFDVRRHRFDPYEGDTDDSITLYNPWLDPAQNATWRCPPGSWGFCYPPRDPYSLDPRLVAPRMIENWERIRAGGESVKDDEAPQGEQLVVIDEPVGSIRWEQLREGLEDYELLCMLRDEINRADPEKGRRAQRFLDEMIERIAPDWQHYTRDPADIDEARRAIVEHIVELRG
ncbi:MAG: hypothetical protein CMJ18_25945 [Phycisphaeraceae bacterium]|nr:hypothetical protein [Phycisphaeraceae bacterium]